MHIVGGLFADQQDVIRALDGLSDRGFHHAKVYGPSFLARSPEADEEIEEQMESQQHTAPGAVEGITFEEWPEAPDDVSGQSATNDLLSLGLPEEEVDLFVSGLHQEQFLLLVQTKTGRSDEAREIIEEHGARLVRQIHPEDSIPEEQWRQPRR